MSSQRLLISIGLLMFLVGGAILAYFRSDLGTQLGTAVAVAGVILTIWSWLGGRSDTN